MKNLHHMFGGKDKKAFEVTEPFAVTADRTVSEICRDFELQEEAKVHLGGEPTPEEFVGRLGSGG